MNKKALLRRGSPDAGDLRNEAIGAVTLGALMCICARGGRVASKLRFKNLQTLRRI